MPALRETGLLCRIIASCLQPVIYLFKLSLHLYEIIIRKETNDNIKI